MSSIVMPPETPGAQLHWRALERLYEAAPINRLFASRLEIAEAGAATIRFVIEPDCFHAAGAAHGTIYFKMLDDAAFYAANTLISDRFLLTTSFNLHFTKPVRGGRSSPKDAGSAVEGGCSSPNRGWSMPRGTRSDAAPALSCARASRFPACPATSTACAAPPEWKQGCLRT
jgi:acyl-coenzyme A thioesterase PaaI-like protein